MLKYKFEKYEYEKQIENILKLQSLKVIIINRFNIWVEITLKSLRTSARCINYIDYSSLKNLNIKPLLNEDSLVSIIKFWSLLACSGYINYII